MHLCETDKVTPERFILLAVTGETVPTQAMANLPVTVETATTTMALEADMVRRAGAYAPTVRETRVPTMRRGCRTTSTWQVYRAEEGAAKPHAAHP